MSSTFPGGRQDGKSTAWAVPDAEILRAIFCHHQTQKEGAGRGSRERRSEEAKRNGRAPAGGGSGWTRRQGPRHKGELTERRGLVDQCGLKGRSGALGTSCVGDCS